VLCSCCCSYGCYNPERDIIAAPYHPGIAEVANWTYHNASGIAAFNSKKALLLVFAGECWTAPAAASAVAATRQAGSRHNHLTCVWAPCIALPLLQYTQLHRCCTSHMLGPPCPGSALHMHHPTV
jgi:hypothetical protein